MAEMTMRFGKQEAGQSFCDLASSLSPNSQHAIISIVTYPLTGYIQSAICRGAAPFQCQLWVAAAQRDLEGLVSSNSFHNCTVD